MGEIAKMLLTYTADVTVRGHPHYGSVEHDPRGPTVTDLAADDRALQLLLRAHQSSQSTHSEIGEIN